MAQSEIASLLNQFRNTLHVDDVDAFPHWFMAKHNLELSHVMIESGYVYTLYPCEHELWKQWTYEISQDSEARHVWYVIATRGIEHDVEEQSLKYYYEHGQWKYIYWYP
jgi:hypothetical protein